MKNHFKEFYSPTPEEVKAVWEGNSLVVLDTNILLNPYLYSKDTSEDLFKILESGKLKAYFFSCEKREHVFASVVIGEGCWLCANVTVTSEMKNALRIIVAAGSVVSKDLEKEGRLYAGILARPIKPLEN